MRAFARNIFERSGATLTNASIVTDHLIDSSLRGMHSHGLLRIPQYLDEAADGAFDPTATPEVLRRDGARINIAGNRAFGQVGGQLAASEAIDAAIKEGCSFVTATNLGHTGRIGTYAETIGRAGLVSIVFASGTGLEGRRVAPFNAREGRLITNPIAYSLPTDSEPLVADFATSAAAEGVVRSLRNRGLPAPPGMLLDSFGHPTLDPNVLYGDPIGTIALLGGETFGYKGFALSLLVEVVSTLAAGPEFDDENSPHNTLAVIALAVDAGFRHRLERYLAFIRSAEPINPAKPVMLPGEPEQKAAASARNLFIDDVTWDRLATWSAKLHATMPSIESDALA